jgi:HAMP domain-containing protein
MNRTNRQVFVRVLRIAGITGLFAFAVLLLLCFLLPPVAELARGAQIVSTGNFDHRITIRQPRRDGPFAQCSTE